MKALRDNEQFVILYARHEGRLRRYVSALVPSPADVDDVLQETAIALMRKFEEYDPNQPFFNWACRFAFYEVMQHRKRAKTRRRHFSDEVVEAIARDYDAHQQRAEERRAALTDCLGRLGREDRRLIQLRYTGEETVGHLAERIGEPAARLYRALARARRLLATCMNKKLALET